MNLSHLRKENGFTLVELLVASTLMAVVLGGAVALTSQIQNGYRRQLEDSAGEQEARYAMEWIGRYLRTAGNNPFGVPQSDCPGVNTLFKGIIPDPNGDGINNDITLQSDSNPPDGMIGGVSPVCNQPNEHVTISLNSTEHAIVFLDEAVGSTATTRTDSVIDDLRFVYRNFDRSLWAPVVAGLPNSAANIFYVQTQIRIRTRTVNAASGTPPTRTLTSEIRVRGR